ALFFLVVVLFAALGERLGACFDALPPNRAYTVNLLASLLGIWAFAALAWLGWPPAGWFAVGFLALLRFLLPWRVGSARSPGPGGSERHRWLPTPRGRDRSPQSFNPGRGARGEGQASVTPPQGWRGLSGARLVALAVLAATLGVVALAPGASRWSPYYRIDL